MSQPGQASRVAFSSLSAGNRVLWMLFFFHRFKKPRMTVGRRVVFASTFECWQSLMHWVNALPGAAR